MKKKQILVFIHVREKITLIGREEQEKGDKKEGGTGLREVSLKGEKEKK